MVLIRGRLLHELRFATRKLAKNDLLEVFLLLANLQQLLVGQRVRGGRDGRGLLHEESELS